MEITTLLWCMIALEFFALMCVDFANRKLRKDHDRLARVTVFALKDLRWAGIVEDETGIAADMDKAERMRKLRGGK